MSDTSTLTGGTSPRLELRNYRVRKFVPELRVDADFPTGVNVLLGVNGVGKTTLLTSIVRPHLRSRGSAVHVRRGTGITDLRHERVCLLPQRAAVPGRMSVLDLVDYCCHLRGVPTPGGRELLERLGLMELGERRADRLSGGQTQRLHLALAFVGDPSVVLLDEPTVALDPLARVQFAEALRVLADRDAVIVMSTHVASDLDLANRVLLLGDRGIRWEGSPSGFLENSVTGHLDDAFQHLLEGDQR